jgi:hypothetical protein
MTVLENRQLSTFCIKACPYDNLISGLNFVKAVMKTPWYCALGMAVSFLPQVYWFKLMFKGAIKMVRSRDGPAQMNEIKKQN